MMIFITRVVQGAKATMVIPEHRLDAIKQFGAAIEIWYQTGSYEALEAGGTSYTLQEKLTVKYMTEEGAIKDLRKFYKACESHAGAFCFAAEF